MRRKSIIWIFLTTVLVISLLIWTIVSTVLVKSVSFGGSTSINLLMSKLTTLYKKEEKKEVLYYSTGSQNGLTNAQNGQFITGFISKEIKYSDIKKTNSWNEINNYDNLVDDVDKFNGIMKDIESSEKRNKYNAIQISTDAIVVIFNPPEWMDEETINQINLNINDDSKKNIMLDIYTKKYTWKELLKDLGIEEPSPPNVKDEEIIAVARESGSGTRDAFENIFKIKDNVKADTVSSNGAMLQKINDNKNTLGYISYGNLEKIQKDSAIQLMGINNWKLAIKIRDGSLNALEYDNDNKKWKSSNKTNEDVIKDKTYKLSRPFIGVFKTNYKNWDIAKNFFLSLFIESNDESKKIFNELGLIREFKFLKVENN